MMEADDRLSNPGSTTQGQTRKNSLLTQCHKIAQRHLSELLRAVFDHVDDTLYQLADKAENNTVQTLYFDTMREIRLKREAVEGRFRHEFSEQFKQAGVSVQTMPAQSFSLSLEGLQLIDEDDLEQQLAITNLAKKSEHRFHELIQPLAQRLDRLIEDRSISHDNGPLMPRTICHAFRDATQALDTDIRIKLILLKLLDRYVMENLATMYQELNNFLIDEGVLPELKLTVARNTNPYTPSQPLHSGGASVAPAEANTFDTLRNLLGNGLAMSGLVGTSDATPSGNYGIGPTTIVVTEDVLAALSTLQRHNDGQGDNSINTLSGEQLKSLLSHNIANLKDKNGSINSIDADTIDLIAMLFDYMFDDPELPDTYKAQIGRLQIPLIKVAILDKTFFSKKQHPARVLLNALVEAGVAGSEADQAGETLLHDKITDVVNRVLNEFDQDIGLFNDLLSDFNAFLTSEQSRYLSTEHERIRSAQAREMTEAGRRHIDHILSERIGSGTLAPEIHTLLNEAWKKVLLAIYLDDGEGSVRWDIALDITDNLLWSLEPKQTIEERRKLAQMIPTLLQTLRQGLTEIAWEPSRIDEAFRQLGDIHVANLSPRPVKPAINDIAHQIVSRETDGIVVGEIEIDPLSGSIEQSFEALKRELAQLETELLEEGMDIPEQVYTPMIFDGEEIHIQTDDTPIIDDEYMALVRNLNPGDWIELKDEQGQTKRAKLEWKGDIVGEYIFVNWRYQVVAERRITDLAEEFRRNEARLIGTLPIIDRALSAIMDALVHSRAKGLTH